MSASPFSTGGGGGVFENCVAAFYLSSVLREGQLFGAGRDAIACSVQLQTNAALDDFSVYGNDQTQQWRLDVSVKRSMRPTPSDQGFVDFLDGAWRTQAVTPSTPHRFGLAFGREGDAVRSWIEVLDAAYATTDPAKFGERFAEGSGQSNQTHRAFLNSINTILKDRFGAINPAAFVEFLKRLVLLPFDFDVTHSSDRTTAIDVLRSAVDRPEDAADLWTALIAITRDAAPRAGGFNRNSILDELNGRFRLQPRPSALSSLQKLRIMSASALDGISEDFAGYKVDRTETEEGLVRTIEANPIAAYVLTGEAGVGKSALLKSISQRLVGERHKIVLSAERLQGGDWQTYATGRGIETPLDELIADIVSAGGGVLILDSLDKAASGPSRGVITDVLREIARPSNRKAWQVLASSRSLGTYDPIPGLFSELGLPQATNLAVSSLSKTERAQLAQHFPELAKILARPSLTSEMSSNLWLLKEARHVAGTNASVTELDLWDAWLTAGSRMTPRLLARDKTISEAGIELRKSPFDPISLAALDATGLTALEDEGVVKRVRGQSSVAFRHDLYEDWTIAAALGPTAQKASASLLGANQPLSWMRAVRLRALAAAEANDTDAWRTLVLAMQSSDLAPLWADVVLVGLLHSERAEALLQRNNGHLFENDGKLLVDLMRALVALETTPNPRILNEAVTPHLDVQTRRDWAARFSIPRVRIWGPFIAWLTTNAANVPAVARGRVADLALHYLTAFGRYGKEWPWVTTLTEFCFNWLIEAERANADEPEWRREQDTTKTLRTCFAFGAPALPESARTYLETAHALGRSAIDQLLSQPLNLAIAAPKEYASFLLRTVAPENSTRRKGYGGFDLHDVGLHHTTAFSPYSALQGPFLDLLRADEATGLALVAQLCSRGADNWRAVREDAIPIDLQVDQPQRLWGDEQVYQWFRGTWGSPPIVSALMALEFWLFEQAKSGRSLSELVSLALAGHSSIAIAGVCSSLLNEHLTAEGALAPALPFLEQPLLWSFEAIRRTHEGSTNLIAHSLGQHPAGARLIQEENARASRQTMLKDNFLMSLFFNGTDEQRQRFFEARDQWKGAQLARYEHERDDLEFTAEADDQITHYKSQATPEAYQPREIRGDQGDVIGLQLVYSPRQEIATAIEASNRRRESFHDLSIAMWAERSLETGAIDGPWTLATAKARIDANIAILESGASPNTDFPEAPAEAAAGLAAIILQPWSHADSELQEWAARVIRQCARSRPSGVSGVDPYMHLPHDVQVFASAGLAELAIRPSATGEDQRLIVELCASDSGDIMAAALGALARKAVTAPILFWRGLRVAAELCAYDRAWGHVREKRTQDFSRRAARALKRDATTPPALDDLPQPVAPWVKEGVRDRVRRTVSLYVYFLKGLWKRGLARLNRNAQEDDAVPPQPPLNLRRLRRASRVDRRKPAPTGFDWSRAQRIANAIRPAALDGPDDVRKLLLSNASVWLQWTIAYEHKATDSYERAPQQLYEWDSALGAHLGALAVRADAKSFADQILSQIFALPPKEEPEHFLAPLLEALIRAGVIRDDSPPIDTALSNFDRCAAWVLERAGRNSIDNEYFWRGMHACIGLAGLTSRYGALFTKNWPWITTLEPRLNLWFERVGRGRFGYGPLLAILGAADDRLYPNPALDWLTTVTRERRNDHEFWSTDDNARKTSLYLAGHLNRATPDQAPALREILALMAGQGDALAAGMLSQIAMLERRQ